MARTADLSDKPVEEPLGPEEVAAMKQHFAFLLKYRKVLRLKLNAAEDLLVNGAKDPAHRGVCLHLLGKVDRAMVNGALTRLDTPEARTRFTEGVVRFSSDVALTLSYLESLSESSSRDEASAALSMGFERIDFVNLLQCQTNIVQTI